MYAIRRRKGGKLLKGENQSNARDLDEVSSGLARMNQYWAERVYDLCVYYMTDHLGCEKLNLQPGLRLYITLIVIKIMVSRSADTIIPEISSDNIWE